MMKKTFLLTALLVLSIAHSFAQQPLKIIHKNNSYYLCVADSILGRDILFGSRLVDISKARDIFAGQTFVNPSLIRFSVKGDLLNVEKPIFDNIWNKDDKLSNNFSSNNVIPILTSFKLKELGKGKKAKIQDNCPFEGYKVVDVTSYFSSEVKGIVPLPKGFKQGQLDSKNSGIIKFINKDNRFSIISHYSYTGGREPFSVTISYTMLLMPKSKMVPRLSDDRINYFDISKTIYNSSSIVKKVNFIKKWRIEPKPKELKRFLKGKLVEPAKPIVFYFDPNIPEFISKYAKLGMLDWNKAFNKLGFKNVIQVKDYPSKDFNSEDITVNCFRYIPTEKSNARGSVLFDPRTGEIIGGEVAFYQNVIKLLSDWRFIQTAAADKSVRDGVLSEEQLGELIRYAVAHETGHVLGMSHNMRASYAVPVDSLRSASYTQKYGTTMSIMDYARNNYVAQVGDMERGVKLTPPNLGVYDYYSLKWAYTFFPNVHSSEAELPFLDKIIREKDKNPNYIFARAYSEVISPDPSSQSNVLGDDILLSSDYGIKNLKYIMKNLQSWCANDKDSYSRLDDMYGALIKQFFLYITNSASYIHGYYFLRGNGGQYENNYKAVSVNKQKQAINFIFQNLLAMDSWLVREDIYTLIGNSHYSDLIKKENDFISALFKHLNSFPKVLNDFNDEEMYREMSDIIYKDLSDNVSQLSRNLQITYALELKKLSKVDLSKAKSMSIIKSASASVEIERLLEILNSSHTPQSKILRDILK